MNEHAWLNDAYGVWHLVTENDDGPVRFWEDRATALAELAGEGWIVHGHFPR